MLHLKELISWLRYTYPLHAKTDIENKSMKFTLLKLMCSPRCITMKTFIILVMDLNTLEAVANLNCKIFH